MKRLTTIFTVSLVTVLLLPALLFADTIELKNGKKLLRVKIQKEGLLKVEYKKPGLPLQYIDSFRVKLIKYDATGNEYKTARDDFENGSYSEAADLFMAVADKSGSRPVFRAHCFFRAAESYQKAGDWKRALVTYTQFANEYNDHRLYPDALENRAICYLNNRETAKAKNAFVLFQQKVADKGLPDYWKFESSYWMTFMEEMQNPSKALKDYRTLYESTKEKYPSIANKARLRIGRIDIKEKKFKEALALFDEIIKTRDPNDESEREVVAWAYLGRGNCIMNLPKKGDGKEEFKRALYDMLRVVYHYSDIGAPQAEAMFWAGKCFQHIGGKDSNKKWMRLFRDVQRQWPGSPWAQDAAKEMGM